MNDIYRKPCNIIYFLALAFLVSSCATIVGQSFQAISINSSPSHANITITDETGLVAFSGTTPTGVTLSKHNGQYFGGKNYKVKIEKSGYKPQIVAITSHPSGWYLFGNIFLGGLIGWLIIDPFSGNMYNLSPEAINCNLNNPMGHLTLSNKNSINICLLEDVPEHLHDKLQPIN